MQIKQRKCYQCIYDGDEVIDEILYLITEYNEDGHVTASTTIEGDEIAEAIQHTYEGDKVLRTETINGEEEVTHAIEYVYNGDSLIRKRDIYNANDYVETHYEYDAENRPVRLHETDSEGNTQDKVKYVYDDAHNSVAESHYDEEGELHIERIKILDGNKNPVEIREMEYDGDYETSKTIRNTYHSDKELLQRKIYVEEELIFTVTNHFDPARQFVKQVQEDYQRGAKTEMRFTLDAKGRIIKEEAYVNDVLEQIREFKYDDNDETIEEIVRVRIDDAHFHITHYRFAISYY